jgi:hypothetical protein
VTAIQKLTVEEAESATGWLGLPAGILEYPGVGASTKFVMLLVYSAQGHTPEEYAEWMDISVEAVRTGLNEGYALGMIQVRDGKAYGAAMTVTVEDDEE